MVLKGIYHVSLNISEEAFFGDFSDCQNLEVLHMKNFIKLIISKIRFMTCSILVKDINVTKNKR